VQRAIETVTVNEAGLAVPKPYSKLTANQESRKLPGIGVVAGRDESDLLRMSDGDLMATLAAQARELGINIDLSYNFGEDEE
jgi:hypothetical protein